MRANRVLYYLPLLLILGLLAPLVLRVGAAAEDQIVLNEDAIVNSGEKYEFQTEVSRLMNLIINSLYKTREIFLRELISNASDALDKIRFISLTDPSALSARPDLNITIVANREEGTLTLTDTGVGMTRDNLRDNLGTIAKSGTSEFLSAVESERKAGKTNEDGQLDLIGQFGVGFYSSFLVADRVTVVSKHNNDTQHVWISTAVSDFMIAEDPRGDTLGRGTQIIMHLKKDALKFLDEEVLRDLVAKYSQFINFPIYLRTSRIVQVPVKASDQNVIQDDDDEKDEPKTEDKAEDDSDDDEIDVQDEVTTDAKNDDDMITATETVNEWELMNTNKPIWTRDPKDVTDAEYVEFYSALTRNPEEPLTWSHFKGEGQVNFRALLYVPIKESEAFFRGLTGAQKNVKLFVKHIFITDDFGYNFLPKWLAFIRAVVDADDLPLNVSRETLQANKLLRFIQRRIIKKALDLFEFLSKSKDEKDTEKFKTLIQNYGSLLKVGAIEDTDNRKRLSTLLRFASSYSPDNATVSLDEYVSRMRANQTLIYFVTGSSVDEIKQSPFLERLLARGYEVMYMTEAVDEILVQHMPGYNGKVFHDIAKGELKFGDEAIEDASREAELTLQYQPLTSWLKEVLSEHIEKAVVSNRLTQSPFAVVTSNFGWTPHMESIMKAQMYGPGKSDDQMMFNIMTKQKKILEINPSHPVVETLLRKVEDGETTEETKEMVTVFYETSAIRSGVTLKDLNGFTRRVETIVRKSLGVDLEVEAKVEVKEAGERTEEERNKDDEYFEAGEEAATAEAERFERDDDAPHDEL